MINNKININNLAPLGNGFSLSDKIPLKESSYFNNTLRKTSESPLSILFFSKENINLLQNYIKYNVNKISNNQYSIGNQSENELKIIMQSVFQDKSRNLPHDLNKQIKELNDLVIKHSVKEIYNSIVSYLKYNRDINTSLNIMEHPSNSSSKGESLEFKTFF